MQLSAFSALALLLLGAIASSLVEASLLQIASAADADIATASTNGGESMPVLITGSGPPGTVAGIREQHIHLYPIPAEPDKPEGASKHFITGAETDVQAAVLKQHNHFRRKHGVPGLVWGEEQAMRADKYAEKCVFEADADRAEGQNLFAVMGGITPAVAVKKAVDVWSHSGSPDEQGWLDFHVFTSYSRTSRVGTSHLMHARYSGIKAYNFSTPGFTQESGLFTQVVWKSSARLGCAYQQCPTLRRTSWSDVILVICNYDPAGNFGDPNEYKRNVLPLLKPPGGGGKNGSQPGAPCVHGKPADGCDGHSPPQYPESPVLKRHNAYRTKHQVGPLVWSSELEQQAVVSAARCVLEPDDNRPTGIGENMYATSTMSNRRRALVDAVNSWYKQATNYNYNRPAMSEKTGTFTQLVWKGSRRLGCAAAVCDKSLGGVRWKQGGVLVVCRYSPAGNIAGEFRANVLPPAEPPNAGMLN